MLRSFLLAAALLAASPSPSKAYLSICDSRLTIVSTSVGPLEGARPRTPEWDAQYTVIAEVRNNSRVAVSFTLTFSGTGVTRDAVSGRTFTIAAHAWEKVRLGDILRTYRSDRDINDRIRATCSRAG